MKSNKCLKNPILLFYRCPYLILQFLIEFYLNGYFIYALIVEIRNAQKMIKIL